MNRKNKRFNVKSDERIPHKEKVIEDGYNVKDTVVLMDVNY